MEVVLERYPMQLTDAEIREILKQEKIKKKRRLRSRRRITIVIVLILIALIVYFVKSQIDTIVAENTPPRGVIFIDPGHGGSDPGSGNGARYEKEDTLKLALAVRSCLEDAGFKVYMSRTEDEEVDRARRGEMANECGAQLMVSIHRNKADSGGDGVEAYIPKDNSAESRLLGTNIVKNLAAQGFTERSVRAGTLQSTEGDYDENAFSNMPSCLVEVGFLSNMHDNELFDNNLNNNAKAIADAIDETFKALYEPQTETETGEPSSENAQTEQPADTAQAEEPAETAPAEATAETAQAEEPVENAPAEETAEAAPAEGAAETEQAQQTDDTAAAAENAG